MLTHTDYDSGAVVENNVNLPETITRLTVAYDGGRLYISVNGEDLYTAYDGTRDCVVEINRE